MKIVQCLPDHSTVVLTTEGTSTLLIWHGEGFSPTVAYKNVPHGSSGFRFQDISGSRTTPMYVNPILAPVPWVLV